MDLPMYEHNQTAYRAALRLMAETGKAAVIHPTGTGKSFLGFQLCQDHPQSVICWLSPSEYIFRTQLENLCAVVPGYAPENIRFFTYARLMSMSREQIAEIRPDYIILDEFHRCGAEMWGRGVQTLLQTHPNAPVLGLSATHIRYLDNQRDMAHELFDGNIASEMTLGEAIVRGILHPPKYVIAVYAYRQALEKMQRRVRHAKSRAVRDAAQEHLDRLRRALDQADGLDVVFQRHMEDPAGKYIVFCSNVEHLNQMVACAPQWFAKVDAAPHIYTAYSDDPDAETDFVRFKQDHSGHLKLLFCIDMLNEGVHVEDISGVILIRPTISPILYKQQIGRALSASGGRTPVIFDIVNNFENLYSIGALEEEMHTALNHCRDWGDAPDEVRTRFQVMDEVRDCREIFERLQETLSASWDLMYQAAAAFYAQNGHLDVPKAYQTQDHLSLGSWLVTQRRVRSGRVAGTLTQQQIQRLDRIGMQWENRLEQSWNRHLQAAREFYGAHHSLDVPVDYVTQDGVALGRWICNLRQQRAGNLRGASLTPERIQCLDDMGMIWDKFSYQWEQNYLACAEYYLRTGNLDLPADAVSPGGLRIGAWIRRMRQIRSGRIQSAAPLTSQQIQRLDAIGMEWQDAFTRRWEYGYEQAARYAAQHGSLKVAQSYVTESGFPLGKWLRRHLDTDPKTGRTSIQVTPERRAKLTALGMGLGGRVPLGKAHSPVQGVFSGAWRPGHSSGLHCRGRLAGEMAVPTA